MTKTSYSARYSNAGDSFHYRWAARRCLGLLDPRSTLVCITVEGVSPDESSNHKFGQRDEVIDIAEYHGDKNIEHATLVSYYQLKHSYVRDRSWTWSSLKKTLNGFFERFCMFTQSADSNGKKPVEFTFVSNRPVANNVRSLISKILENTIGPNDEKTWNQIKEYLNTDDERLVKDFFAHFHIDDGNDVHWRQRNLLVNELNNYMVGHDADVADQLWRLVCDKASPEHRHTPEITQEDVLHYLNTTTDKLFPANCLIEIDDDYFAREQEDCFLNAILECSKNLVIIHADGGVGKTVLATRLRDRVPDHSVALLYDCFGKGGYRNLTLRRDEHRVGLVQIANELASLKLCYPLIPWVHAKLSDYLEAFNRRIKQSIEVLKGSNPSAKLVLLIDAADNAQMAAEEYQERASFVKDLIREQMPPDVVLVLLCRSHRIDLLKPTRGFVDLRLDAFSADETGQFLRKRFPEASTTDVLEFHHLSTQNPRVQAIALNRNFNLLETLTMLGPEPTTVEEAIKNMFVQSLDQLRDDAFEAETQQIQTLCEALAALRPFIPIEVLHLASGLSIGQIQSFILELGRPLSLTRGTVQFLDEPTETWFRETYKPKKSKLIEFIATLQPLTSKNSYVASALPQLMLEAGQYRELVELVLEDRDLPSEDSVETRFVSLQRLQFALKAALRNRCYVDSAKLALKAGCETAGNDREESLIQANTDLFSHLLPARQLQEIVSQKNFSTDWHGGNSAYLACLLSGCEDTLIDSRGHLRVAHKWVQYWSKQSEKDRTRSIISDNDIAEIAMCQLYLNGPIAFCRELECWTPPSVAFDVGSIVFRRLIDLGQISLIDDIAVQSKENVWILLAAIHELNAVQQYPQSNVIGTTLDALRGLAEEIKNNRRVISYEARVLSVVNSVVQAAIVQNSAPHGKLADILDIYLPCSTELYLSKYIDQPQCTLLRAICLRAALRGETVEISDLVSPDVKKQMEEKTHTHDSDTRKFLDVVGSFLPWQQLWTQAVLGLVNGDEIDQAIEECVSSARKATHSYSQNPRFITHEISILWFEILLMFEPDTARMEKFVEWKESLQNKLFTPTLTWLIRLCANAGVYSDFVYAFAREVFEIVNEAREDATQKIETYIEISRAIYALSTHEAKHYLNEALEVAGRTGRENLDRWSSLLDLSLAAADPNEPNPELCYRFSRAAELVYDYVDRDKHFDWEGTIEGITNLCPSSSLSIMSRWKDRKFCYPPRVFPYAVNSLIELEKMSPLTAMMLIGYKYQWQYSDRIRSATSTVKGKTEQTALLELVVSYLLLRDLPSKEWVLISDIASEIGWKDCKFEQRVAKAKIDYERDLCLIQHPVEKDLHKPTKDWDYIFADLNQTSAISILKAYERMRAGEPPYVFDEFVAEFYRRVTPGKEKEALEAVFNVSNYRLYHMQDLFKAIPTNWLMRNHIRSTLAKIVQRVCKEHAFDFRKSRHYESLPYELITRQTRVSEEQMCNWVVEGIAEYSIPLESDLLFSLVGFVVPELTKTEATSALDYGLKLLEEEMTDDDGDGSWLLSLQPPNDVATCLAGYIWVSLGSPDTAERWEAAHVVCLMCAFNRMEVLKPLQAFALGEDSSSFHDSDLPIYEMSAKLWLMIALRRAVKRAHFEPVLIFEKLLRQSCIEGENHVLIREIAAKTLLDLLQQKHIDLSREEEVRLQTINQSKFEVVPSDYSHRSLEVDTPGATTDDEKYYFGLDFQPYWFSNLANLFALHPQEIENRVLKIIREDFDAFSQQYGRYDPRRKRDLYAGLETHHSHGSYPKVEDLTFYHSYHALMMVAGELINTVPRQRDIEGADELEDWIQKHNLTRKDGFWLADRRDPVPLEIPSWKSREVSETWCYSVTKNDLLESIKFGSDHLCVWGSWNFADSNRVEDIRISSALVVCARARALMIALQTASRHSDYLIPSSGDRGEIDSKKFRMKGWILNGSKESGIDGRDPWAGAINYPPIRPAKWFAESNNIHSDDELRNWYSPEFGEVPVLYSREWGEKSESNIYETPSEIGSRLIAKTDALKLWLNSTGMDLIIEVLVNRKYCRGSHHFKREDELEHSPPYALIVIFRSNGEFETI